MRSIPLEKVQYIIELYPHTPTQNLAQKLGLSVETIHRKAYKLGLRKTKECMAEIAKICSEKCKQAAKQTQFKIGSTPHNKGQKMPEEVRKKCSHTMFKKGSTPATTRPLGYERINQDGSIEVKTEKGFKSKARAIWEEHFGAVPNGKIIVFADGNNRNFDLSNLIAITRSDHAKRNSFYSPEYKETLQLLKQIDNLIKQYHAKKYTPRP